MPRWTAVGLPAAMLLAGFCREADVVTWVVLRDESACETGLATPGLPRPAEAGGPDDVDVEVRTDFLAVSCEL